MARRRPLERTTSAKKRRPVKRPVKRPAERPARAQRGAPPSLRLPERVFVTRPTMPPLAGYVRHLEAMWDSRQLTNRGPFHEELEARLAEFLGEPHVSLFCNGTIALLVALQALRIGGGQ